MTELTPAARPNRNACVSSKNGSYRRTGLPLLLNTVQPEATHRRSTRGPPSTTRPGSACDFIWISRPKPSEYDTTTCVLTPPAGVGSEAWVSRTTEPALG